MTTPAENLQEQPLVQHLIELRSRLLRSFLAIFVVFLGLFSFANEIYEFVAQPLQVFLPENSHMIATEVASPFLTPFKLTLFASMFLCIPFIFYQIWAFVSPALYRREKRLAIPLITSSVLLFYAGMAFAYYVVFPLVFSFFTSVGPESVAVMTDISKYQAFVIKLFFAFGAAFEIPIATILLISAGVLSPAQLASKRPYVLVGCFVVGMLLTPPDIISQALLAIPMWLLFEIGIFFGRFFKPAEIDTEDEDTDPDEPDDL
ncbi:twin-arginine translocase subunit TatC [Teredinibacter franksiae]|uniref:twin-arginine translocase subunit TatC n=1 Tax=Teredinibacter franksiae TaxID=2761453 RepID=UPI00162666FD|nr:twin-arginine translocase subunit TatC [Teredinibacter franksiae]